jgi:hypothetical protein
MHAGWRAGYIKLLSEFKSALDHTRHSVWALIEALADYSGHTVDEVLQNFRMQRASELLHVLHSQIEITENNGLAAARTFLDEVQIVTDLAYRRHLR